MYRLLKWITLILGSAACLSLIIFIFFNICTFGVWSWEKIELEYIDTIEIKPELSESAIQNKPYTINKDKIQSVMDKNGFDDRCCFEIRNQDDWEYVKDVLQIENDDTELDFTNYYIISFGWEIESLKCQKARENSQEVVDGKTVKKENSYQENVIHIYRMSKNIVMNFIG